MSFNKKYLVLLFVLCSAFKSALSNVSVTPANAGTCLNVSPGAYLPIGNIIITEGAASDLATQTNTTLILTAPAGFTFQFGVGTLAYTPARNITAATVSVTLTTITVTLTTSGTSLIDQITISGVNARASATNLTGTILRKPPSGGTATIVGDLTGGGIIHVTFSAEDLVP